MNIFGWIKKKFSSSWFDRGKENIDPDEIFLDSKNLPKFDRSQFEGRIERPISHKTVSFVGLSLLLIAAVFVYRFWSLQVVQGNEFAERSENNSLRHSVVFADRGVIYDRNGELLAWNEENPNDSDFSMRKYANIPGIANIVGYVKYPSKDSAGFYYRMDYVGMDGVEKFYDSLLSGENGIKITETNVHGKIASQSVMNLPVSGKNLTISIDSRLQGVLYEKIAETAKERGFTGGAAVVMDVKTGEIIAEVTYPEYDSQIMTDGQDSETINSYFNNKNNPLLDRSTSGLYTPGSIIKPFVALGALNEGVISANKVIYTTGSITIPSPYDSKIVYVYRDWKNHGAVDMRRALEQSSDVYFYQVSGGYKDQPGIGIDGIEKYTRMFGFGSDVGSDFFGTKTGTIPNREWKKANFNGDIWRVGDTYHTSIGQYGFQVTPIQMARAYSAIANYGNLIEPSILYQENASPNTEKKIELQKSYFDVIHDGMRRAAQQGTAVALNVPYVDIAAKTGTAELGITKDYVNSWVTGFFPYETPRYAFVVLMEKGSRNNLVGASYVARQFFDWMSINTPEYLK